MKIKLTSVYVDDQEKALRFYTEVLGFAKKADFSQGPYRWLTVASPEDPDGTQLQLALNDNPAAKAYQQAMFQQGQPAAMFFSDDVKGDYERIKARGAEFTMAPTQVTGSTIAKLNDTCGNLIQITQLRAGRAGVQQDGCPVSADIRGAEVGCKKMFERLTGVIARSAGRRNKYEPLKVQIPSTVATGTVDGISVYNESGRQGEAGVAISPAFTAATADFFHLE